MDDLRRRLEQLSERGEPRGAERVLAAARRRSGVSVFGRKVPLVTAAAIAASVMLIAGLAAAVWVPEDSPRSEVASPPTTASPSTTEAPSATVTSPPSTRPPVTVPARLVAASRLQPFRSWNAYLAYVKGKGAEVVGPFGLPSSGGGRAVALAPAAGGAEGDQQAVAAGASAPDPFSSTNNQEEGIDEPDLVKTNGRTIFALTQATLRTVPATGTPGVLATMSIPDTSDLLLVGDRVVAMGTRYDRSGPRAVIAVVDVTRPGAPQLLSRFEADGHFLSARLVNGVPRIVLRTGDPKLTFSSPSAPEDQARATEANRQQIAGSGLDHWVPSWTLTEGPKRGRSGRLVNYDQVYRPPTFSGFGMVTVMTLNVADPSRSHTSSVVGDGSIVYGSANRMYVASNGWQPVAADFSVRPVDETLVHAFDITAPDRAAYKVSGKVRGVLLNQFALSEDAGVLRVATTSNLSESESFVTTFEDQGQILQQIGQVGGLGRNERIHGVRFIGKAGYVVTFRQVDPLYVVDLSEPRRPVVRGELKILGYSAYLHPVGPGLLLGIGVSATEEGRRTGLQASLFDVSNPAVPKRVQQYEVSNGWSPSEFDHHSFLYWAPTNLAVLPISAHDPSGGPGFAGAVGLRVATSGLGEVGRIQHPGPEGQRPPVRRSLVIGNRLYTLAENGIMQSDLGSLQQQAYVAFW